MFLLSYSETAEVTINWFLTFKSQKDPYSIMEEQGQAVPPIGLWKKRSSYSCLERVTVKGKINAVYIYLSFVEPHVEFLETRNS